MNKVGFISLGRPKNLVDSEVMMGQLKQNGYEITSDASDADTVVVNTCGFIDAAKESIEAILEAARLKTQGNASRLIVAGCLVERYRDELKVEMPEVDAFIGTNQINEILDVCDPAINTRWLPVIPMGNQTATYLYDESTPRARQQHRVTYAFIKVAEGCDRPCAFCFIPQMRGQFRSRRFGSIVAEAQQLAEEGVKELILVAQDSSRYGEDLGKQDALAHSAPISHTEGIEWVRVMYTYPTHISDEFLECLQRAQSCQVSRHASTTRVSAGLRLMKRGGIARPRKIDQARSDRVPELRCVRPSSQVSRARQKLTSRNCLHSFAM